MKRPSFQFYPGDWLRATELRSCSVGARGLWIDMICFMHEGSPYGHLKVNSKVITPLLLARMVGESEETVTKWLAELEDAGVFSRTDDGCIFSRRMIKDENLRDARASGGKLGGNPKLTTSYNIPGFVYIARRTGDGQVKIGISQHPAKRMHKIRAQHPGQEILLLDSAYVGDMGAEESRLHKMFDGMGSGEWFDLADGDLDRLKSELVLLKEKVKENPKENPKENQSPASASASALPLPPTDVGGSPAGSPDPAEPGIPACPHQQLIALYHEILPLNPRVIEWNETRQAIMRSRWRLWMSKHRLTTVEAGIAIWRRYFEHCSRSKFLTGQSPSRDGKPPFCANLEWLIRPQNLAKIVEGNYHEAAA